MSVHRLINSMCVWCLDQLVKQIMNLIGLMGGVIPNNDYNSNDRSDHNDQDFCFDNTRRIYLRDQFRLPQYIFDKAYESHDQFITVETEDGLKILHIYHLSKTIGHKTRKQRFQFRRLFRDYKTGQNYYFAGNDTYRRLPHKQ